MKHDCSQHKKPAEVEIGFSKNKQEMNLVMRLNFLSSFLPPSLTHLWSLLQLLLHSNRSAKTQTQLHSSGCIQHTTCWHSNQQHCLVSCLLAPAGHHHNTSQAEFVLEWQQPLTSSWIYNDSSDIINNQRLAEYTETNNNSCQKCFGPVSIYPGDL